MWTYDLARDVPLRFTPDPAGEYFGVWSADGRTVIFNSTRKGHYDLYGKPANGAGPEELVYADGTDKVPVSWSHDGRYLLYYTGGGAQYRLWVLRLTTDPRSAPRPTERFRSRRAEAELRLAGDTVDVASVTPVFGRAGVSGGNAHDVSPDRQRALAAPPSRGESSQSPLTTQAYVCRAFRRQYHSVLHRRSGETPARSVHAG